MSEKEEKEFLKIVSSFDKNHLDLFQDNWYDVLGLAVYYNYDESKYNVRNTYVKNELVKDRELQNRALICINTAKSVLKNQGRKNQYDSKLKSGLKKKLENYIANQVEVDKELDKDEREAVMKKGKQYGFSGPEIDQLIEVVLDDHDAVEVSFSKSSTATAGTTSSGIPVLKVEGEKSFTFEHVKLHETRFGTITVKNDGGGMLDATVSWTQKWLEVVPSKIHQSNLPQKVTIMVSPGKDPAMKNGSGSKDIISLVYRKGSSRERVDIPVFFSVEGHSLLVDRMSKYAVGFASVISVVLLVYVFSHNDFSGWAIFGFIVSAIAISIGISSSKKDNLSPLIVGGVILLITNWLVFLCLLPIVITWFASRAFFSRNPHKKELVAAIPIGVFAIVVAAFFGLNYAAQPQSASKSYKTITTQVPQKQNVNGENVTKAEEVESNNPNSKVQTSSSNSSSSKFEGRIPTYVVNIAAYKYESQARKKVKKLINQGYSAGYLWPPDYSSISNAELWVVFIGPYNSVNDCGIVVENYKKIDPKVYGVKIDQRNERVEIRGRNKIRRIPNYNPNK